MTYPADALVRPIARRLHADHMKVLGIGNTMRLARAYNGVRFRRQDEWRRSMYEERFDELLAENGGLTRPILEMTDGWAIDTSGTLPHLDAMLEQADEVVAERAGERIKTTAYRSYFQDLWTSEDNERYPAFLDFATSSDVVAPVANYLGCVPALSTTLPSGIRLVESNVAYDEEPDRPKDSQLFHIDYYSLPNVYVLVLLRDTTVESGPWCFLPRSVSERVAKSVGNWRRGRGYRFSDDEIYSVARREELIEFTYPRGTVLFIESSGCFHYGSRNSVNPRFQVMLAYSGACRTDFSDLVMKEKVYPRRPDDSLLRRMVLNRRMLP
jgi:hypothetical protein